MTPKTSLIGSLLLAAAVMGCNSKGLVPVEGRVTFGGQPPPAIGYLYFVPRDMSINNREDRTGPLQATALFAADGTFHGTTFTDGDGLRPGTYEVRMECEGPPAGSLSPEAAHNAPVNSLVPSGFTPPDLVVPASGPRPVRFDLDVPK